MLPEVQQDQMQHPGDFKYLGIKMSPVVFWLHEANPGGALLPLQFSQPS
jgi:hypothetical protein